MRLSKWMRRGAASLVALFSVVTFLLIYAYAAGTFYYPDSTTKYLTITESSSNSGRGGSVSTSSSFVNGTFSVTMTVKSGNVFTAEGTCTVTITNNTSDKIQLKFDYSVTEQDSTSLPSSSGTFTGTIEPNSSTSFTVYKKSSASWGKEVTRYAYLTCSNFQRTVIVDPDVTVNYDSALGSVTVAGSAVSSGNVTNLSEGESIALAASANSDARFLGWINEADNSVVSTDASFTLTPPADISLRPVFISSTGTTPWFMVGSHSASGVSRSYLFDNLNDAISLANSSALNKYIVLLNTATLPGGTYTIPSGVTFLVPYAADGTFVASTTATVESGWNSTWEYANNSFISAYTHSSSNVATNILMPDKEVTYTLTIPSDTTLNVASGGKFVIGGTIASGHVNTAGVTGGTAGAHSNVQLNGTINVSGILSSCGYIRGGQINVAEGGTVYQPFVLMDHRDGHYAVISYNETDPGIYFPFNRYTMMNIQSNIHLVSGANMKGYVDIYTMTTTALGGIITVPERHNVTCMSIIGSSGALINNSGTIDISYNSSRCANDVSHNSTGLYDRVGTTTLNFSGDTSLGNMSLTINVAGTDYKLDTDKNYFPVPYNYIINLNSGDYTIGNMLKLLPGAEMTVASDANLIVSGGLAVMDGFRDHSVRGSSSGTDTWHAYHYPSTAVLQASPLNSNGTANLIVNGTMTVTGSFGGLVQTNGTGTVTMNGTNSISLGVGAPNASKILDLLDTAVTGKTVRTLHALLFNANGGYITMTSGTTYYGTDGEEHTIEEYSYTLYTTYNDDSKTASLTQTLGADTVGSWCPHSYSSVVTPPTCVKGGYTTHTCAVCGDSYQDTPTDATGNHSYNGAYTAPENYKSNGCTTYTCTVCGDSYTESLNLLSIYATSVRAGDSLDLYFYVKTSDVVTDGSYNSNYYAVVTKEFADDRGTTEAKIPCGDWTSYQNDTYRRFCFTDISAKEMTDNIYVTIYDGNDRQVFKMQMETIQGYATRYLARLTDASGQNVALRTALIDMLNYGAAAQTYFGYGTDQLANDGCENYQQYKSDDASISIVECSAPHFIGSSVTATNNLALTLYYDIKPQDYTVYVSYKDHYGTEKTLSEFTYTQLTSGGETVYGVVVPELAIADGRQLITCALTDSEGNEVSKVTYSIEGYAALTISQITNSDNKTDEDLKLSAFCKDLMKFVDSAWEYFHYPETIGGT